MAISLAFLPLLKPGVAMAEALQKFYLPPERRPPLQRQRADPYLRFREYIQPLSRQKKQELLKRYESSYEDARNKNDEKRRVYYSNLIAILNRSLWN
ncbi:MAG: hypothetical protein QF893_22640 [Alphaproteobacteria bacterium]|jgi:predicted glycosyl hydrolase (DUF1957 family)|nr:hypothetical protein [Alphaproteobacteria bacterium]